MNVFQVELHDNEKIIMKIRQHWVLHLWPTLKLLIMSAIGAVGLYFLNKKSIYIDNLLAFLLWLVWTLLFLNSWLKHLLHWYLNIYIVTNKRIINITHSGIFRRQMTETSFHKVQDVTVKTLGLVSMLLDYGDVVVQTAGHATYIHFYAVPKPREIHKKIVNTLAKYHFHPQSEKPGQPSFMAAKTHEP